MSNSLIVLRSFRPSVPNMLILVSNCHHGLKITMFLIFSSFYFVHRIRTLGKNNAQYYYSRQYRVKMLAKLSRSWILLMVGLVLIGFYQLYFPGSISFLSPREIWALDFQALIAFSFLNEEIKKGVSQSRKASLSDYMFLSVLHHLTSSIKHFSRNSHHQRIIFVAFETCLCLLIIHIQDELRSACDRIDERVVQLKRINRRISWLWKKNSININSLNQDTINVEDQVKAAADHHQLNNDCVQEIADRVTHFRDLVAISGVCQSWRYACSNMYWDEGPPKPPCLMLSEIPGNDFRVFYNVNNQRIFQMHLLSARGRRCWGSPHGFVVSMDPQLHAHHLLINPISQACIGLPPLTSMVHKSFLLKIKNYPHKFLVMAILEPKNQLVCTKPGDNKWVLVRNPKKFLFRDVAHFRSHVYALCDNGSLIGIDITNGYVNAKAEFVASHPEREFVGYQPQHGKTGRVYLVESQNGIFGVFRFSGKYFGLERTIEFVVYKFNFESLEWEVVWSIDDMSFFINNGNSWSIGPANQVDCKNNSIYFVDDMENGSSLDMGVYDMETWQIECLRFGAEYPRSHPLATWFTPGLTPTTLP